MNCYSFSRFNSVYEGVIIRTDVHFHTSWLISLSQYLKSPSYLFHMIQTLHFSQRTDDLRKASCSAQVCAFVSPQHEGETPLSWWAWSHQANLKSITTRWETHWTLAQSLSTSSCRRKTRTVLSNEAHLKNITTISDMPSATVRCTLKAFLRLLFLRCISPFLFTLQLLRDCDKNI